jgi:hypothetical protein
VYLLYKVTIHQSMHKSTIVLPLSTAAEVTLTGVVDADEFARPWEDEFARPWEDECARPLEDDFAGVALFEPGAVDADALDVELEGEFARMALFDSPRTHPETVMLYSKLGCCIANGLGH